MILAFNAVGAIPPIYKGVQHQVGPELVSVYSSEGDSHEILTRVQTLSGTGFVDTGQGVQVYLRNGYKDDEILYYPRWTFIIAMCMVVNHLALTQVLSMSRPTAESPTQS